MIDITDVLTGAVTIGAVIGIQRSVEKVLSSRLVNSP